MTNWTGLKAAALIAALSAASAEAQAPVEMLQGGALRASLSQAAAELEAADYGGHVSVLLDGEIVFAASLGPADPANGAPYHLHTQTDTGSIAKPFTGLLAASLIAEGRLDPLSTLADWFERVPPGMAGITVHQLLTHNAGLPAAVGPDHEVISREAYLERVFETGLDLAPGERFSYSNVGFSLMAMIIEIVTGEDYDSVLQDTLLTPLQLHDTGHADAFNESRSVRNRAGEAIPAASWGQAEPSWHLLGNGGLISSPQDMLQFGQHVLAGGNRALEIMIQPYISEGEGSGTFYGYGIVLEQHPDFGRMIWHNGGNPHFVNHWRMLPEANAVIFTTTNMASNPDIAAEVLTAALYGVQVEVPRRPQIDQARTIELPDTPVGRMAGEFFASLNSEAESDWRAFLEMRASPAFLAIAPMDAHIGMFRQLHGDLAHARIHAIEDAAGEVVLTVTGHEGVLLRVMLGYEMAGEEAVLNGLGIDAY